MKKSKQPAQWLDTQTFLGLLQFLPTIGNAGWGRFASIFFLENGVTATQLSIIGTVQAVCKFVGYPTFGILADFFGSSKHLLLFSLIFSRTIILAFYFESTKAAVFSNFYLLLFIRGSRSYINCIWSLVDAVTMKLITDKKQYGKYRLFCSIAWGTGTLLAGALIDRYGIQIVFLYSGFWSLLTIALIYFAMPDKVENYAQHKYQSLSQIDLTQCDTNDDNVDTVKRDEVKYEFCQIFTLLMSLRHDHQFVSCCVLMLIYWNVMFIIERIIFIQMDQEFGATKTMMGFATLCSTIAEVPFFYYSVNVIRRFTPNQIFAFCHVMLMIRLCSYTLCKDISMIWIFYVVELIHGINFALAFTVCRMYLYQIGENYSVNNELGINVRASVQSLKGLINIMSMFIGSLIWLPMYDYYNADRVYFNGSFVLIPSIIVLWSMHHHSDKLFNVVK